MEGKSRRLYYQTVNNKTGLFVREGFANIYTQTNIYAMFTKVAALDDVLSGQSVQL